MHIENDVKLTILVVEDIEETRDGIEVLLKTDGYRVEAVRNESEAVESARRKRPDLILVSLGGTSSEIIATARHIRARAELRNDVPVVVFCTIEVGKGAEVDIGQNVYATCPDNFNQLRNLLTRLLREDPMPLEVVVM